MNKKELAEKWYDFKKSTPAPELRHHTSGESAPYDVFEDHIECFQERVLEDNWSLEDFRKDISQFNDEGSEAFKKWFTEFEVLIGLDKLDFVQNYLNGFGTGISKEKLVSKVYWFLNFHGINSCILNDKYIEIENHIFEFIRKRSTDSWLVKIVK